MAAGLTALMLVTSLASGAAPNARQLEEQAFTAVSKKKLCEAMSLFLAANAAEPSADLVFNAAHAADLADDRVRALALFRTFLRDAPMTSPRREDANKRAEGLAERIGRSGFGKSCAVPAGLRLPDAVEADPDRSAPGSSTSKGATETSTASAPDAPKQPAKEGTKTDARDDAAPPDTKADPAHADGGDRANDPRPEPPASAGIAASPALAGWVGAGVGGVMLAGGGAAFVVGLQPWFAHADAHDKLSAAESSGSDPGALPQQQADARAAWDGWGKWATGIGAVAASVGVVLVGGGIAAAVALQAPPEESATSPGTATPAPLAGGPGAASR